MVLDPFSALGAAGNIIQFVDFGCKLVRNTQAIAREASGSSRKATELSAIATDIKRLAAAIANSDVPTYLRDGAKQCQSLAQELLGILNRLSRNGKGRKWGSFLIALREIWNSDKISDFMLRLSMLQDRLTADMQFVLVYVILCSPCHQCARLNPSAGTSNLS